MSMVITKKRARVVRTERHGADTRLLEIIADEPLGFVGGQFVTVDTGLLLPNGKPARRAYSVLTADAEQQRFELASKRIPDGPCSGFMHTVRSDTELWFTGPWGKFHPREGSAGPTLVLATDTGISAALGLVQGRRFEPLLERALFIWFRVSPDYFLPDALVRRRIPARCGHVATEPVPAIGAPNRLSHVRRVLARFLERTHVEQAFICGDGDVNYALLADLAGRGVSCTRDHLESFFNMPKQAPK